MSRFLCLVACVCFSLLLCVDCVADAPSIEKVTVTGTVSANCPYDKVGLFSGGGDTTPKKFVNIVDGKYSIDIDLKNDLQRTTDGLNIVDLRFWQDKVSNNKMDRGHENISKCHFIYYDQTGKLYFHVYHTSENTIEKPVYEYNLECAPAPGASLNQPVGDALIRPVKKFTN